MSKTTAGVATPPARDMLPAAGESRTERLLMEMPDPATERRGVSLGRRLNYFWLALIIAMLVGGCTAAGSTQPVLWHSWRGPVMVLASLGILGWYWALMAIGSRYGWPLPRHITYAHLVAGFALIGLLLSFSAGFAGLLFALMGVAAGVLPYRESPLPIGIAVLLYLNASGVFPTGGHSSPADPAGALFDVATSVGIIYALTALVRERYQREDLFRGLSQAHRELSAAHRRLRLSAAREVDLATLRERNRLAREMHDSLGHALVSISIKLEAARLLATVDADRAAAELEETTALVRATMTELRHSLAGLRPAALEEQPLGCALAEMAREMERRTGIETSCDVDEQAALLDRDAQEALYRVGQEALTNVAKHARASHVALALNLQDGQAVLEVSDDGVGLGAAGRNGGGGYGVTGMRERLEALGGVLTLGPRPGGGTTLRARVPAEDGA